MQSSTGELLFQREGIMGKLATALRGQTSSEVSQAKSARRGVSQQPSGKLNTLALKGGTVAENPNTSTKKLN